MRKIFPPQGTSSVMKINLIAQSHESLIRGKTRFGLWQLHREQRRQPESESSDEGQAEGKSVGKRFPLEESIIVVDLLQGRLFGQRAESALQPKIRGTSCAT